MRNGKDKFVQAEVPFVSKEFAMHLAQWFRAVEIKPGVSSDQMQYSAGEQRVVKYVLDHAIGRTVSGPTIEELAIERVEEPVGRLNHIWNRMINRAGH